MPPGSEQLTIAAKALGFDESAKAVDVLTEAQKRLVDVQAQLANAKGSGSIAEVAGLTQQQTKLTEITKQLGTEQKTLNASESDYVQLLVAINPILGRFVDAGVKAARVAGEMAAKNIDAVGAFKSLSGAAANNAAALKLVGAGGAVVVGILAITAAVRASREEHERNTRAIQDETDALDALQKQRDLETAEENRRSARRPDGPFSAEESRQAADARERLAGKVPSTSEESRARAVELAGADADIERQKQLAILIDNPGRGPAPDFDAAAQLPQDRKDAFIDRLFQRRGNDAQDISARERDLQSESNVRALDQAGAQGGSTEDIQKFIDRLPGKAFEGADVERLAKVTQGLVGAEGRGLSPIDILGSIPKTFVANQRGKNNTFRDLSIVAGQIEDEGVDDVTEEEVRQSEFILKQLRKKNAKQRSSGANITVNNNDNRFSKNIGMDALSQRRRSRIPEDQLRQRSEP